MGAAAAEAPLRLPAAPPLAFCCYTSVLLLFAFSLPGSRASNQPAGGGSGSGGGGECPGGKGKSINCSGRTGRSLPRACPRPLPPSPGASASRRVPAAGLGKAPRARGGPGERARGRSRAIEGGGRGAGGAVRAGGPALGMGSGRACVRVCRAAGRGWPGVEGGGEAGARRGGGSLPGLPV